MGSRDAGSSASLGGERDNLTIYANTANFDVTDGTNRLAWDSVSQTLTVEGILRILGNITLGGTTG